MVSATASTGRKSRSALTPAALSAMISRSPARRPPARRIATSSAMGRVWARKEGSMESLTSGGPYASPGFLQDRLDAFGGVWGGTTLGVVGVDHLVVGAFQLADTTDVNTVRVYGRLHGEAALLGTLHREGRPVV